MKIELVSHVGKRMVLMTKIRISHTTRCLVEHHDVGDTIDTNVGRVPRTVFASVTFLKFDFSR